VRIALELTLLLSAAGVLLFALHSSRLLDAEQRELHAAVEQEVRLLGRSLQATAENALRDGQTADVQETLQRVEAVEPSVDVFAFGPDGTLLSTSSAHGTCTGRPCALARQALERRTDLLEFHQDERSEPLELLFALPLLGDDGAPLGALSVLRPLADLRRDLGRVRSSALVSVAAFVVLALALGLGVGAIVVGRPMRRLVKVLGQVGAGDLSVRLPTERWDEFGLVGRMFNGMVADLAAARGAVEDEVAARRRLEEALRRADRLAAVGQLAAQVAHEIGSPLQVLGGRAQSIATRPAETERVQRDAESIARQADRIERIVAQLLRYAGKRPPRGERFDGVAATREILDLLRTTARQRGVTLTLAAPDGPEWLWGDRDWLQQIVLNLTQNALHATSAGGSVVVRLARDGDERSTLRLVVEDDGCGMADPAAALAPFFTTRADAGGIGLGLTVVRSLVEEQEGRLAIESTPGAGTRVTVRLPSGEPTPGGRVRADAIAEDEDEDEDEEEGP
jgi:signal transduction histidine kinase